MDNTLRASLNRQLDDAMRNNDIERLQTAQVEALKALVDCQCKTSARVKRIDSYINSLKLQASGAKWVFRLLNWLLGAGLGGTAIAIIRYFGE